MTVLRCEYCNRHVDTDEEWFEGEAGECETCFDARTAKEAAYWYPLWKAEQNGLTPQEREEGLQMRLREMRGLS